MHARARDVGRGRLAESTAEIGLFSWCFVDVAHALLSTLTRKDGIG